MRAARRTARTTRHALVLRAPRTPRSPRRRFRASRLPARRSPRAADTAAPRAASSRSSAVSPWTWSLRLEVVRVLRQVLGAVRGHEHEVLQPYAAVALPVAAGFDGDHVAGA